VNLLNEFTEIDSSSKSLRVIFLSLFSIAVR